MVFVHNVKKHYLNGYDHIQIISGKELLHLNRIKAFFFPAKVASVKMLLKSGLEIEGYYERNL